MRLLARRALSSAELKARLENAGAAEGEIADALARARHLGYLDDRALAAQRAHKLLAQGFALDLATQKLAASGFDEAHASEAVREAAGGATSEELVRRAIATSAARSKHPPQDAKARRRLARALAAKGHDPQLVLRLLHLDEMPEVHP